MTGSDQKKQPPLAPESAMSEEHMEEGVSLAHVHAIAAFAGCGVSAINFDYGLDGTIRRAKSYGIKKVYTGYSIDFQLKASFSKYTKLDDGKIGFVLDSNVYNMLICRNQEKSQTPLFLIACVLDRTKLEWVKSATHSLVLKEACYWKYLTGTELAADNSSKTIYFTETDLFTSDALRKTMTSIEKKKFKYGA